MPLEFFFPFCTDTESVLWRDLITNDTCKCGNLHLVDSNMHDVHKIKGAEIRILQRIRVIAQRCVKILVFPFCQVFRAIQARFHFMLGCDCPKSLGVFSF